MPKKRSVPFPFDLLVLLVRPNDTSEVSCMLCQQEAEYRLDNFMRDVGLGQGSDRRLARGHSSASRRRFYTHLLSGGLSRLRYPFRRDSAWQKKTDSVSAQNGFHCEATNRLGSLASDPVYGRVLAG